MAEFAGRTVTGFDDMVKLADTVGAPVWDVGIRLNFPNRHPLNLTEEPEAFKRADLICGLDLRDWEKPTTFLNRATRETKTHYKDGTQWMKIGFEDLDISRWSMDYGPFPDCVQRVLADTALALPALADVCATRIAKDAPLKKRIDERKQAVKELHDKRHEQWLETSKKDWDNSPFTLPRLALEVWDKIKNEDWVLTAGTLSKIGRCVYGTSTNGIAMRGSRSGPGRRSARRSASRWPTRARAASSSISSPTAT